MPGLIVFQWDPCIFALLWQSSLIQWSFEAYRSLLTLSKTNLIHSMLKQPCCGLHAEDVWGWEWLSNSDSAPRYLSCLCLILCYPLLHIVYPPSPSECWLLHSLAAETLIQSDIMPITPERSVSHFLLLLHVFIHSLASMGMNLTFPIKPKMFSPLLEQCDFRAGGVFCIPVIKIWNNAVEEWSWLSVIPWV